MADRAGDLSSPREGDAALDALDLCGHCRRPRKQHTRGDTKDCCARNGVFLPVSQALKERRNLLRRVGLLTKRLEEVKHKIDLALSEEAPHEV